MKYLKKFETQAAYTAAKSGLILPNVSLITENNKVEYNPSSPTPSHDYVEIGGIKWATMNVGATGVTDYGLHFQWGDTQGYTADEVGCEEGKKCFVWADYKYTNDGGTFTKYNNTDGLTTLEASDDAVTAAWGGNWRMPTGEEIIALFDATTSEFIEDYEGSGVDGYVYTDKTDSSKVLFFPFAGAFYDGSTGEGLGYYWSSSIGNNGISAAALMESDVWENGYTNESRYIGCAVRGVVNE